MTKEYLAYIKDELAKAKKLGSRQLSDWAKAHGHELIETIESAMIIELDWPTSFIDFADQLGIELRVDGDLAFLTLKGREFCISIREWPMFGHRSADMEDVLHHLHLLDRANKESIVFQNNLQAFFNGYLKPFRECVLA